MLSISFLYLYKRFSVSSRIYDIICQIHHHLRIRGKGQFNCSLLLIVLHYPDVYQPCKPVILQQTQVPNSSPMGANYVDYEPQGTGVIQACLQTTPLKGGCNGLALHQNNSSSSVVNSNHKPKSFKFNTIY